MEFADASREPSLSPQVMEGPSLPHAPGHAQSFCLIKAHDQVISSSPGTLVSTHTHVTKPPHAPIQHLEFVLGSWLHQVVSFVTTTQPKSDPINQQLISGDVFFFFQKGS